jgi:hypothetical protein
VDVERNQAARRSDQGARVVRRSAALGAALAAMALAVVVSSAMASGSYTVTACSPSTSAGPWTQVDTAFTSMTTGNECGPGGAYGPAGGFGDTGALYAQDIIAGAQAASGTDAGWQFTAPSGTLISAISYWSSLETYTGAAYWQAGLFTTPGTPAGPVCTADEAGCAVCETNPAACNLTATGNTFTDLDTPSLFFGVYCAAPGLDLCSPGGTQQNAQADLYSASVTLSESSSPSLSGVSWPTGSVLWGSQSVSFAASDPSGISQVAVDGSGGQAGSQSESCNYSQPVPCSDLPSGTSLGFNTASLHDGSQALSLVVTDAAGNTSTVTSSPVVIDNNGPPAPSGLSASAIAGSTMSIQVAWSNPSSLVEPVASAVAQVCGLSSSCGSPSSLSDSGSATLPVSGAGSYTVHLWLIDTAGRGSSANEATTAVTVPVPPPPPLKLSYKLAGKKLTLIVAVPSGATGKVTFTLQAYNKAGKLIGSATLKAGPSRGSAVAHVTLSPKELKASKITVSASAAGAQAATLSFAPTSTSGSGKKKARPGVLKLSYKLSGKKLQLTAGVPKGATGEVTFTLYAYNKAGKLIASRTLTAVPSAASAVAHLTLSSKEAKASTKLDVTASATGTTSADASFKG